MRRRRSYRCLYYFIHCLVIFDNSMAARLIFIQAMQAMDYSKYLL